MAQKEKSDRDPKVSRFRSPVTKPDFHKGRPAPNKGKTFPPATVSNGDFQKLLDATNDGPSGRRTRAWMGLLFYAELRPGQVVKLDRGHYDERRGILTVPQHDRTPMHVLSLDDRSRGLLEPWLASRRALLGKPEVNKPLFSTIVKDHLGYRITRAQMRNTLQLAAENAGLEKRINLMALTKSKERRREKTSILADHFLDYLDDDLFRDRYQDAYDRWESALELVERYASKDADTIGNHCRHALEFFADGLCALHGVDMPDDASTKQKIKAVVAKGKAASKGTVAVLEAITDYTAALDKYLAAVSPYSQRQTHIAKREKESITLEDGRRLVFQTMMVMYEIDRGMDQLLPQPKKRAQRKAA